MTRPCLLDRPGLGVVSLSVRGDGVPHVARLLERALPRVCGSPVRTVELSPARPGRVTPVERLRFFARVLRAQAAGEVDWFMFDHMGIARSQLFVPGPLRRRFGVVLHGTEAWDPGLDRTRRAALRAASFRMAISHHTAERVREVHPEIGAVMACPLGLLPDGVQAVEPPDPLGRLLGTRSVLIVGRMRSRDRYKGHDELLECWPLVRRRVPDARLIVIGDGDDADRLREKAEGLGLGSAVHFAGFLPESVLRAVYERAGVFAMPSRGEGFGLVYLEAMRAGLPCVASNVDAAQDSVVDGETGFLVSPDDRRELSRVLVRLLTDEELRTAMGSRGRRRYEERFTFEAFVRGLRSGIAEAFGRPIPVSAKHAPGANALL